MDAVNKVNFIKCSLLLIGPCTSTLLNAYKLTYALGGSPEDFADHLDEFITFEHKGEIKEKKLKNFFTRNEINVIKGMKKDRSKITSFDISLYNKLIRHGSNCGKLTSPSDDISEDELEKLLCLVLQDKNNMAHGDPKITNLTKEELDDYCEQLLQRLPSIINLAGTKANANETVMKKICQKIVNEVKYIRDQNDISALLGMQRDEVVKIIKTQDLEPHYLENLKETFSNELRAYCPPTFMNKSDKKDLDFKDLLSSTDAQVIIIDGEAGFGKTSLTKFLFYQSLSADNSSDNQLSSFDFMLRIVCRSILSTDICSFLESELPNGRQNLPDTSSLQKNLEGYSILWVADGFDESTIEFKGFFQSLLTNLSKNHRIIITTRPDWLDRIDEITRKKNVSSLNLSIKKFNEQQNFEVAGKYLAKDKAEDFALFYKKLEKEQKELMATPINLNLCLEMWEEDPSLLKGKLTTHELFKMFFEKGGRD